MGRFLQPDLIGYGDGLNIYRYCSNNPVNFIDPSGLKSCENDDETSWLDWAQGVLDGAGMFPGLGIFPDGANVLISAGRGNWVDAGLSLAAMIPIAGQGATAAKWVKRANKVRKLHSKGANKAIVKAAKKMGITDPEMIKDFGKYVEDVKNASGRGGKDHLSFDKLKELAQEFKGE